MLNILLSRFWITLYAVDDPITSFEKVLGAVLFGISGGLKSVRAPLMIGIAVVSVVGFLWRYLSAGDDPNEMSRGIRNIIMIVGGAALVLYVGPTLLEGIASIFQIPNPNLPELTPK